MARILVIENDEELSNSISIALSDAGYTVITSVDAIEGLGELFKSYPDMIIMDSQLPKVSGDDALLRVHKVSFLPIIVIGRRDEIVECLENGADAFMAKPLGIRELVARVKNLLKRKSDFDSRINRKGQGAKQL